VVTLILGLSLSPLKGEIISKMLLHVAMEMVERFKMIFGIIAWG